MRLFCLLSALVFIAAGCKKKEPEPPPQAVVEAEEKPTKPGEPTKSLHQAADLIYMHYGNSGAPIPYDYIRLSVEPTIHNDYGLTYPITYEFSIPADSSNLKAYKRYTQADAWGQITEKTNNDFFNGIETVRFDYSNNRVYISVAFVDSSDEIQLKVTNASGQIVDISYQGIPDYYDNRDAAVVATGDDWDGHQANNIGFQNACDAFSSRKIWFTVGITTDGARMFNWPTVNWNDIQAKIDARYIEAVSHSREHLGKAYSYSYTGTHTGTDNEQHTLTDSSAGFPVTFRQYTASFVGWVIKNMTDGSSGTITSSTTTTVTCDTGLSGGTDNDWDNGDIYLIDRYDEEIGGSRDEIIANLELPTLNKKGTREYVYAWIEPYGYSDSVIREKLGQYKYLADRDISEDNTFAFWDSANHVYNRIGFSYELLPSVSLAMANNNFDSVIGAGGIYHIMMHPRDVDWSAGSWVQKHLDYIKGKTNLWYVGFGHLYLYHYIDDQNIVNVAKVDQREKHQEIVKPLRKHGAKE